MNYITFSKDKETQSHLETSLRTAIRWIGGGRFIKISSCVAGSKSVSVSDAELHEMVRCFFMGLPWHGGGDP